LRVYTTKVLAEFPVLTNQKPLKPSKISPPPGNGIDIALRGIALPGQSLLRPP
jgi:hypothetical protein